jgi:hypothetical protein
MIRPVQATTEPSSATFRIFDLAALSVEGRAGLDARSPTTRQTVHAVLEFLLGVDPAVVPMVAVVAPDIILDHQFAGELAAAIADPGLGDIDWLALVSDGVDTSGELFDSGNYLEDPATPTALPLRLVRWADPAIAVIAIDRLQSVIGSDPVPDSFPNVVEAGAARGAPVLVSRRLRFSSMAERATLPVEPSTPIAAIDPSSIRPDPTISVIVRTATARPAMLDRNLAALAREHAESPILEVVVASAADDSIVSATVTGARLRHHELPLRAVPVDAAGKAPRSATMLAGLAAARGDYVWYVDDDDWVATGSVERIKSSVHAADRPILVGAVEAYDERWEGDRLLDATLARRYFPREWYRAFTGWNFLPNCSLVIPRERALARVSAAPPQADLGEDYALQLLLFTAAGATVHVIDETIANISWRTDGDSVVAMEDRTPWLRDLGSHISDLSNDPVMSTTAWWRLGAAVREIPYPNKVESPPDRPPEGEASAYTPHPAARFVPRAARPAMAKLRRQFRRPSR